VPDATNPLFFSAAFLLVSSLSASPVFPATADELVAGARKEGVLELYAASTLGPGGSQALTAAFNKKHGLNIKVNYHPSGNMTRDIGKIVGLAASSVTPEWGIMVVTDAHHGSLWTRKLHLPFDYKTLGVDGSAIQYDGGTVSVANQMILPAYNKKTMPAKDVPKKWEDLLDPKWKDGKLGVISSTHHWARLAAGPWGVEKTTEFIKKLTTLKPILGRGGEIAQRLLLGEILIATTMHDDQIQEQAEKQSPMVFADQIQPVISAEYHAGVLKGAAHPSTGHLFAAFMTTPEAQEILDKYLGLSSVHVKGTRAHKFAQGRELVFMKQDKAQLVDKLSREYGKILGFD
jgi:iron(III) transport system substrate-binding protein